MNGGECMFDFLEVVDVDLSSSTPDTSNWQRVFFDLEGSLTTRGDILQMAAITTDWDYNITDVFNMYFKNKKPIDSKEFNIHQISEDFLSKYGKGHFTEMLHELPFFSDKPTMFISYTTFDVRRVQDEMRAYNLPLIDFGEEKSDLLTNMSNGKNCHLDAFRYGKKKGVVVSSQLGEQVFADIYKELREFGHFSMKTNHDALYDTVMILALCRRFADGGISG